MDFIIVGGFAGTLHGSSIPTRDLDIVYSRDSSNIRRLVEVLSPHSPYLRGAPPGLPFRWEPETIASGLNFTLTTDLGAIDLLGEIAGGGGYQALLPDSVRLTIFGIECRHSALTALVAGLQVEGAVYNGSMEASSTKADALAALAPFLAAMPNTGFAPAGS